MVGRRKEKEQMLKGTRMVMRRNSCADGWKRKRKGTDVDGKEKFYDK